MLLGQPETFREREWSVLREALNQDEGKSTMRTFHCVCGNRLFFGNTNCVNCGSSAGFCPGCREIVSLIPREGSRLFCGNPVCGIELVKCRNYEVENVCNGCVSVDVQQTVTPAGVAAELPLCEHCQLTEVIPDLSIPENRQLWARLEDAKRRVLFTIELLKLPIGRPENEIRPLLTFDFRGNAEEQVLTGHDQGKITINIAEADDVERERIRVAFSEPQRTLVGHFRHELGHYFWDVLVQYRCEEAFRQLFGDERSPPYQEALNHYHQNGPKPNWQGNYISAYATMHPWEDFAETFGTYLDMISILDTSTHLVGETLAPREFEQMLRDYREVGIYANELNREMGLKDLVPEVFGPGVTEKLRFVHELVNSAPWTHRGEESPAAGLFPQHVAVVDPEGASEI